MFEQYRQVFHNEANKKSKNIYLCLLTGFSQFRPFSY